MYFKQWWQYIVSRQSELIILAVAIATLWLGATEQLQLYIHPRYIIFTIIMMSFGLCAVVAEMILLPSSKKQTASPSKYRSCMSLVVAIIMIIALLVLRPAVLTTNTIARRGINTGASTEVMSSSDMANIQNSSQLTVKEWSSLLGQTRNTNFFVHKPIEVTGFVSTYGTNRHIFYISRFVVTCCAVDARAVGVPVYVKDWQSQYKSGEWITIRGSFMKVPTEAGQLSTPVVVSPHSITKISQPKDPYEQ